jgi:hypothetical protein
LPFSTANTAAVARFLPPGALDIFCKAANGAEQAEIDHNGCIRQGWAAVKSAGWAAPATGKKWVFKDSVHREASWPSLYHAVGGALLKYDPQAAPRNPGRDWHALRPR